MVCFSAASHDYMFKHLEVKDGLSNNQVNAIYKDSNGFMWFGTASGLNRYDGYSIKVYRSRQDDEKSLPDSYIEKIQEDAAGNLWLETGAGYAIYNSVSDDFNRDVETWMWNIGIVGRPTLIYIDKEKDFWIYVMGKGVYRYKMGDKDAEIVKIADKIAYLGRDIEDAIRMEFIEESDIKELMEISRLYKEKTINTTVIIHNFITSICENSSPEAGIRLSDEHNAMLNAIKDFNYRTIYKNPKFNVYRNYAALIIRSIYDTLMESYDDKDGLNTIYNLMARKKTYPNLISNFVKHLLIYSETPSDIYTDVYLSLYPYALNDAASKEELANELTEKYKNRKIYGLLETKKIYAQAIIDYISGMTDRYAIEIFNELIRY